MQEIQIREAKKWDVEPIVELSVALFREDAGQRDPFMNLDWPREEGAAYYARFLSGGDRVCFVAEADGWLVGFLTGYAEEPTNLRPVRVAELESMFVRRAFRNQGVGARLVDHFVDWCQEKGAQRMSVTAYSTNLGAIEFYRGLDFEPRNLTLEMGLEVQTPITPWHQYSGIE
jgi:GNAT superfamily N-acetyltransferase